MHKNSSVEYNLNLVFKERFGDILFLIGTLLAIISTCQAEQALLEPQRRQPASGNAASTLAAASWLFFAASIIFAYVALARYEEAEAADRNAPKSTMLVGSRIAAAGNVIKAIGFALAAIGNQLKANATASEELPY